MATIDVVLDNSLAPAETLRAAHDFSDRREKVFPAVSVRRVEMIWCASSRVVRVARSSDSCSTGSANASSTNTREKSSRTSKADDGHLT